MKEDREGRLWIASANGIFFKNKNKFIRLILGTEKRGIVFSLLFDHQGDLWFTANPGPGVISQTQLNEFIRRERKVISFDPLPQNQHILKDKYALVYLDQDKAGNIFGMGREGKIFSLTRESVRLTGTTDRLYYIRSMVVSDEGEIYWADPFQGTMKMNSKGIVGKVGNGAQSIFKKDGDLWALGTAIEVKKAHSAAFHSVAEIDDFIQISLSMLVDKDENIWVGTNEGLFKYKKSRFRKYPVTEFPLLNKVFSMLETPDQRLLFGTSSGRIAELGANGKADSLYKVVNRAEICDLLLDKRGWLWAATGYEGTAVVRNGQVTVFNDAREGFRDNTNFFLQEDSEGNIWEMGDNGVTQILVDDATLEIQFRSYKPPAGMFSAFPSFRKGYFDKKGNLWLFTEHYHTGVYRFAKSTFHLAPIDGQKYLSVTDILMDDRGFLWVSTNGNGVYQCRITDKNGLEVVRHLTSANGLPTNTTLGMCFDDQHALWIATFNGIVKVDKVYEDHPHFVFFDKNDGFLDGKYQFMFLEKDRSGRIWGYGTGGTISFQPKEMIKKAHDSYIEVTSLTIMGTDQVPAAYIRSVDAETGLPNFIQLPYHNSNLTFRAVPVHLDRPDANRIAWRLEGLEKEWHYAYGAIDFNYASLPTGSYSLQIRGTNSYGEWGDKELSLKIIVTPPFWNTWWFYCFVIGISAYAAYTYYKYWIREKESILKNQATLIENQALKIEKTLALQEERNRIAAEMHDDFGASITSIRYLTYTNQQNGNGNNPARALEKISLYTAELMEKMSDIIWAMNSQNDNLENMISFIRAYTGEFAENTGIKYAIDLPDEIPETELSGVKRRNIGLAFKECIQNIAKHAGATEVKIRIQLRDDQLIVEIKDNGVGLVAAGADNEKQKLLSGNGLLNIEKRMKANGGTFEIQHQEGTKVTLITPL
jgi:signal transduction histidine kinase/ligand-binding sensor domain-containing protein